MLSKGDATQWPMLLDMTKDECRKVLRRLELEAYSSVVTVLRAQGSFTLEKKRLLQDLAAMLSISTERHRAEIRLAVNSEKLATIAEQMSGPNTGLEWSREGRRIVPLMPRLVPQTAFIPRANLAAHIVAAKNAQLPQPSQTAKKMEIKKEPEDVKYSIPEVCTPQSASNNMSLPLPPVSTPNTPVVFAVPLPPSKPTLPLIPSKSTVIPSSSKSVVPPSPLKSTIQLPPSKPAVPASSLKSTIPPVAKPTDTPPTKPPVLPTKPTVPPTKSTVAPPTKSFVPVTKSTVPPSSKPTALPTKSTVPPLAKSTVSPVSTSSTFVVPAIRPSSSSIINTPSEPAPSPSKLITSPSTFKVPIVTLSSSPLTSNNSSVPIVSIPSSTSSESNVSPPTFVIPAAASSSATFLSTSLTSTHFVVSPSPSTSSESPAFIAPVVSTSSSVLDTCSTIVIPPSPLSSLLSVSSAPNPISNSSSSTLPPCTSISIDTPLTYVVSSISNPLTVPTVSSSQHTPVSNDLTSTVLSPLSTSSFLSSIPLISIPPSSSFSSPITATSAVVSSSPLVELVDLAQPLTTTALRQLSGTSKVEETNEKAEDNKMEDESSIEISTPPPPTLMLPSGMSIQLREGETDKPKKRKRSLSQDSTPVLHKKIITVPLTKVTGATPMRTMTIQTPVKISVNTPVISRINPTSSCTSTQKVIIVSNTNSTPNILQKSLSIVKSNNRFQSPQLAGNSLQSGAAKLRPKMLTVPAKCRPRSNSVVIPMSTSIQNIQLKSAKEDNTSVIDSTVKCLTIPNVPGTTRILPKPSSMLIVNPTSSKVPLTSTNTRLISSQAITEGKTIKSSTKTGKPNVVIVRKGSVSKGLKITNASKELMSKMLSGKSIPVQPKQATISQPMPIATTSGNLILLDLSQDHYSRNATIAEILQASGILPANLSVPPAPTNATVTVSSASQHITVSDVESAAMEAQSSDWIQLESSSSEQIVSNIQERSAEPSVITLDGPLEFLNEEESGSSQTIDTSENTERGEGQTEVHLVNEEERQVFSLTTDLIENNIAYISAEKQFESQSETSQIIIEAVPTEASGEHSEITFLPSLNAPVTIQHSDLDASNMPLEEYTSQQIENQGLT